MLRFLRIRNLAVIEAVEVEFEPGFNVLTGETGAGKSILVEAVGLLLGARASADLVRTGETAGHDRSACSRTIATAASSSSAAKSRSQGRSRSFINGALATAGALRDLSQRLVELHGQHEHQALLDPLTHLPLLDGYAELDGSSRSASPPRGRASATLREQLERSRMDAPREGGAPRADRVSAGRDREGGAASRARTRSWPPRKQVLASAERVQRLCEESYAALYDSDEAVLAGLGGVWKRVGELAAIDPQFAAYVEARDGIKSQLEDLAFFLRSYADGVDASPARLQQVEDRLALLERLKRKYGPTLAGGDRARVARSPENASCSPADGGARRGLCSRLSPTARDAVSHGRRASSRQQRRGAARRFARELEALARRAGDGADPVRGAIQRRRPLAGGVLERARHRPGGVLPVAQSRRGAAAARADRLRRRAVARDAGAEDAGAVGGRRRGARR